MLHKASVVMAAAFTLLAAGWVQSPSHAAEVSGCDAGEKIDGSSVVTARKKIKTAGYQQIHGLKKGCDSFWHGKATKDGAMVNIVLTPRGEVLTEGD